MKIGFIYIIIIKVSKVKIETRGTKIKKDKSAFEPAPPTFKHPAQHLSCRVLANFVSQVQ